jgi:hypothetical protein
MGAGRRGASRGGRHPGRYGSRPVALRPTLPVLAVVCDDSRTAVKYFHELRRELRSILTLSVEPSPHTGAAPAAVVKRARAVLEALRQGEDVEGGDRSSTWALIDLEREPERRAAAEEAAKTGAQHGVRVLLSDPCYEVWTLLHLEDTGAQFDDCMAVVRRIRQLWKQEFGLEFDKSKADYARIIGRRHVAARRAQQHCESNDPSRTEVYRLITELATLGDRPDT